MKKKLEADLLNKDTKVLNDKSAQKKFIEDVLEIMTKEYKSLDPQGQMVFDGIFTKRDSTYSGSEEQEFYFCKLLGLNSALAHDFPLIVDSFRDGEISSPKEDLMLTSYKALGKQVILTSTLKEEEYAENKYVNDPNINAIDYSTHEDSKILNSKFKEEFITILNQFSGIVLE